MDYQKRLCALRAIQWSIARLTEQFSADIPRPHDNHSVWVELDHQMETVSTAIKAMSLQMIRVEDCCPPPARKPKKPPEERNKARIADKLAEIMKRNEI